MWVMDLHSHGMFSYLFCCINFNRSESFIKTQKTTKPHFEFAHSFSVTFLSCCFTLNFKIQISSKLPQNCLILLIFTWINIMEELQRLDLLINLQSKSFKEMMEEHVSYIHSYFANSFHGFPFPPLC